MKFKKALSLLLSLAVIFGTVMPGTLATAAEDDIVIETTAPEETTQPTTAPVETSTGNAEGTTTPAETTDPTTEPSTKPENTGCTECGQVDGHAEGCSQYVIPASKVCSECGASEGHLESCSQYEAPETEPANENTCNCVNPPENLANHADSCPRKQYILSLVRDEDGYSLSAQTIYSSWESYDAATRTDILNILEVYHQTTYSLLIKLIEDNKAPESEKETTVNGTKLTVQGVPKSVVLQANHVVPKAYPKELFDRIGSHKLVFSIDISLTNEDSEWQPDEGKKVTVTLDASDLGLQEGARIGILHEHNGELKELETSVVTSGKLTFETDGFSTFYGYTVDFEYDGTWYSIGGGGNIYLYELFAQLGIRRSTSSVTSVSFSDPNLLSVSKEITDGYIGETDWYLRSLKPFNTEEILTVAFSDGSALTINVYDANYTALTNNLTLKDGDSVGLTTVSGNVNITLNGTVTITDTITIPAGATLTINGSGTFKRSSAHLGKMFYVNGGTLTINGSIYIDGSAAWSLSQIDGSTRKLLTKTSGPDAVSAAIHVENNGSLNMTGVTMQNLYTASGQAPAIETGGKGNDGSSTTVTLTTVTVQNCASHCDNAIVHVNDSVTTMNGCTFTNNACVKRYAGVIKAGGPTQFCQLTITNCTATGNYSSGWGGVILWAANNTLGGAGTTSSKATISGCTFTNNTARYLGGAISNEAIMEINGTTITNNTAMAGGGIAAFPFTRTIDTDAGGNACGLTLGAGNHIEANVAYAAGVFKPFSSEGQTADDDEPGSALGTGGDDSEKHQYTGGGGGVWCYMNKARWTCSLEISTGNTIKENTSNNVGGGVYVDKVAGETTTLSITGAEITKNKAANGGGVAVYAATVSISSGSINENSASTNGGGIYVDNGGCNVSGSGSIKSNQAANGGGIYIASGNLTVTGGVISGNKAKDTNNTNTVDQIVSNQTAFGRSSGVGGGIYVLTGTFTMSNEASKAVGIYGNLADFAADDAYASGNGTTLTLPDVANMSLEGAYESAEGWFVDYVSNDTKYTTDTPFTFANDGRYRTTGNTDNPTGAISVGQKYYCLTLGRILAIIITKVLDSNKAPDSSFMFKVTHYDSNNKADSVITVTIPASAFALNREGKMEASVLVAKLATGSYTVEELVDWSWRYELKSVTADVDKNASQLNNSSLTGIKFTLTSQSETVTFTNEREENKWLSGDCWCENWWGQTTPVKKDED